MEIPQDRNLPSRMDGIHMARHLRLAGTPWSEFTSNLYQHLACRRTLYTCMAPERGRRPSAGRTWLYAGQTYTWGTDRIHSASSMSMYYY